MEELQSNPSTRDAWIEYSVYDAEATWRLRQLLEQYLTAQHWAQSKTMMDFYREYIVPFAVVLTDMEREGIRVDVTHHLPAAQRVAIEERDECEKRFRCVEESCRLIGPGRQVVVVVDDDDDDVVECVDRAWAQRFTPEAHRMNISSDAQKAHLLFAPCVRLRSRNARAQFQARAETTEVFGVRRPVPGDHPQAGANGVLTAADWSDWAGGQPIKGAGGNDSGGDDGDDGGNSTEMTWPMLRAFKVDNIEQYVEPGKVKPKKQRELILPGLGLTPVEYTASGWPAASASVLRQVCGDPAANPPRYGTAFAHFGGGDQGREACEAIRALFDVGAIETMLESFIIPLQHMADSNSRIHCSLNLNTETGRLSARRPNLQNQPALEKVAC